MNEQIVVEFDKAAFKHDISREDILHAFQYYCYDGLMEGKGYEDKYLRIGFDHTGNLLEIVYHELGANGLKFFGKTIDKII